MGDIDRVVATKAYLIGRDNVELQKAQQQSGESSEDTISIAGLFQTDGIETPYDLGFLCKVYEHSNSLRQNVNAYMTNIDGFGHVFEPLIELREAGARDIVRDEIWLEKQTRAEQGIAGAIATLTPPTEEEITAKIEETRQKMRLQKAQIESFFDNSVAESSFVSLRQTTRENLEATGNGYWEIIRNDAGAISQFVMMPSRSVRVSKRKSEPQDVRQTIRVGTLTFREETYKRRFHRYIQIGGGERSVYFKEYGDPSIVSSKTGVTYPTLEELKAAEEGVEPANEVLHFKIGSLRTNAYGVPRWIGNLLSVLGSRSAEEVNYSYFENKAIPPIAILVSGGRLGSESVKRIENFVETQLKGIGNFHKILVIEAETTAGSIGLSDTAGAMRVEIKQLTDAQLKDGLFLEYDAANMDKVGMGFRLPRMLRGDIRDFNRASAEAALDFAESQVFVPERNDFDFLMNRLFLPALGVNLWKFKSNGPRLSDAHAWGEMIKGLTREGILTPEDARELVSKKILGQELPRIDADWVKQPIALSLVGIQTDAVADNLIPLPGVPVPSADPANMLADPNAQPSLFAAAAAAGRTRLLNHAKQLMKLRDAFRTQEAADVVAKYKKERVEDGEAVFRMTAQEIEDTFNITRK